MATGLMVEGERKRQKELLEKLQANYDRFFKMLATLEKIEASVVKEKRLPFAARKAIR